jgi:diaminohydroxyphosphoribosylaminopyrimidine deaminase / 5-amino-6-(5-phosphoribosylamino)uracil reductase
MENLYLRRCFDLGGLFRGHTKTNPLVGAVLSIDGGVLGEGAHRLYGDPHAEVNAIHSDNDLPKELLQRSTLFVSLEPCFHFGKTPPCVNLILDRQIPKVRIACTDPNPLVGGKSILKMQQAGIEVVSGIEADLGEQLIRPFTVGIQLQRPYIILKYAHSADGFMGLPNEPIWFTNIYSKHLVHKWRSEVDAIVVGKNTALIDNPTLTNRLYFGKKAPVRILLDKNNQVPSNYHIFNEDAPTWIVNKEKEGSAAHLRFVKTDFEDDYLLRLLQSFYQQQIGTILIEGGAKVLNSFIEAGLWDEARVFSTTKTLNSDNAIKAPSLPSHFLKNSFQIDNDTLNIYINKY